MGLPRNCIIVLNHISRRHFNKIHLFTPYMFYFFCTPGFWLLIQPKCRKTRIIYNDLTNICRDELKSTFLIVTCNLYHKPSGNKSAIRNPLSHRIRSPGLRSSVHPVETKSSLSDVPPGYTVDTLATFAFGRVQTKNLIVWHAEKFVLGRTKTHECIQTHTYTRKNKHTHTHTHTHTYKDTQRHINIHIHIHSNT